MRTKGRRIARATETDDRATRTVLRAAEATFDELPANVRPLAARALVDTVAVARAGAAEAFCASYAEQCARGVDGPATVFGGGYKVPVALAAFLNALPTTVLQIDEGHRVSRGHPGIHVVPASSWAPTARA